jgi:hypothetical protein
MRFILLSLLVLGAGGCAKHGIDTVKDMRASACAGDSTGFFNHVDRTELARMIRARVVRKAQVELARPDPSAQANFDKRVDAVVATSLNDTFAIWEHEIKRGPAGDLCLMSIMESSEVGDTADVHVRNPADYRWKMARQGDRWMLVGVE